MILTEDDILTNLDVDLEPSCEHSQHPVCHPDEPGQILVAIHYPCMCLSKDITLLMCQYIWNHAGANGLYCGDCGRSYEREEIWTFIQAI